MINSDSVAPYQARYDHAARREGGTGHVVITQGEVRVDTEGPVEVATMGDPPAAGRKRKGAKAPATRNNPTISMKGMFGEAKVEVLGASLPLDPSGVGVILESPPGGFSFVPPEGVDAFEVSGKGFSAKVVHVGLRGRSPTGEGEILMLLTSKGG